MTKKKVVRQSLKDQIKSILIDRMVEGSLAPGDRIKELVIANEFGTSQAPVREAIRCLETLGYVEHIPHVGVMVKQFNRQEVEEAYQVREALEVQSVIHFSGGIQDLVTKLKSQLKKMKGAVEKNDIRRFIEADNMFHRMLVEFSHNATMLTVWDSLKMQLQVIATLVEASMPLDKIYSLHPPIVEALEQEKFKETARLLKGHYQAVNDYWQKS